MFLSVRYPTDTEIEQYERIALTSEPYGDSQQALTIKGDLTPSYLSRLWNISLDTGKRTLQSTKQNSMDTLKNRLTRRQMANNSRLNSVRLSGYLSDFVSDTFFSNVVKIWGNECVQTFTNRANYVKHYPMAHKSDTHHALHRLRNSILTDGVLELKKSEWGKSCQKLCYTENLRTALSVVKLCQTQWWSDQMSSSTSSTNHQLGVSLWHQTLHGRVEYSFGQSNATGKNTR